MRWTPGWKDEDVEDRRGSGGGGGFSGMGLGGGGMRMGLGGMLVLLVATVLSVYKPRGLTACGALALKGVGSVSPVPRE